MLRVYRYRLHPTAAQEAVLQETLWRLRELYNAALQERRDAYRKQGIRITKKMQDHQLKELRDVRPEYDGIHTHLLHDVVTRLDRAFRAFFRRVKAGEKPGYAFVVATATTPSRSRTLSIATVCGSWRVGADSTCTGLGTFASACTGRCRVR